MKRKIDSPEQIRKYRMEDIESELKELAIINATSEEDCLNRYCSTKSSLLSSVYFRLHSNYLILSKLDEKNIVG